MSSADSNYLYSTSQKTKRRVSYFYKGDVGHYYYGPAHPMKPHRLKLTHHLILAYGLYRKMEVYRPHLASSTEMGAFHTDEYVSFLRRITPDNLRSFTSQVSVVATMLISSQSLSFAFAIGLRIILLLLHLTLGNKHPQNVFRCKSLMLVNSLTVQFSMASLSSLEHILVAVLTVL